MQRGGFNKWMRGEKSNENLLPVTEILKMLLLNLCFVLINIEFLIN